LVTERMMGKTRTAPGRIRVMATLDRELVERVDVLADLEHRSRSQMVELVLLTGLPGREEEAARSVEIADLREQMERCKRTGGPAYGPKGGVRNEELVELQRKYDAYMARTPDEERDVVDDIEGRESGKEDPAAVREHWIARYLRKARDAKKGKKGR
jgi:predicted transcriptional regulator